MKYSLLKVIWQCHDIGESEFWKKIFSSKKADGYRQ
jgi:hypothetical protein